MSQMKPIDVTTRDGMIIHGYLTVPHGSDGKNLPLIVNPHGGPHGVRDDWGFNPEVQLLANRGFAVLQMNYRGSGGYGNAFISAGYRNWGTSMQDDLTDSVNSAGQQGHRRQEPRLHLRRFLWRLRGIDERRARTRPVSAARSVTWASIRCR